MNQHRSERQNSGGEKANAHVHDQVTPRFTWRDLAGLFGEAWHREQRRRQRWLIALAVLIAAGVFVVALTGGGGNGSANPGPNVAARSHDPVGSKSSASSGATVLTQTTYPNATPQNPQGMPSQAAAREAESTAGASGS